MSTNRDAIEAASNAIAGARAVAAERIEWEKEVDTLTRGLMIAEVRLACESTGSVVDEALKAVALGNARRARYGLPPLQVRDLKINGE